MTGFIDIDGALITAYQGLGLGLPTSYEGEAFEPPTDFSDWAEITSLPASVGPGTTGLGGWDEHRGILQISFATKPGTGKAALMGYAEAIRNEFVAGKGYDLNGQHVLVEGVDRSQIIEADGWARIAVSINWIARTIRPIF